MISVEQIQLIHETIASGDWIGGAQLALVAAGDDGSPKTIKEAVMLIRALEASLAAEGEWAKIAVLLWGNEMFDSRPSTVKTVFKEVCENSKLIIFGGSSLSKSYSCGVLYYLRWRSDPYWTAVKLSAPSEDHLRTNLFSHLSALHKSAIVPMTDDDENMIKVSDSDLTISINGALPEMGIIGILCKAGTQSAGSLRGHKPKPYRTTPHPKYGKWTVLLILIDECTQVPEGAFNDIKTTEASIDPEMDNVTITMACNPEGVEYKIVRMAEPPDGWDVEQVDKLYKWMSKEGYPVIRLDGKNFENVVERKTRFKGMLTYEAYIGFLKAGEHSATYWAKGRGFPPLKDNAWTIVPPAWMQSQRGEPLYVGRVTVIAILDTALSGSDNALLAIARWGEAAGWTNIKGEMEWFRNRANPELKINKHCAVVDQLITLPKTPNTVELIQEVMGRCKNMGIPPENVVMDRTGNAAGVWSHAKKYWGDVLGVDFGTAASDTHVLAEDQMTAYDIYDGKVTELWFAMKRWLDPSVGALYINPTVPTMPLFTQITTRRYRNVKGGRVRVEPKHEFRARNSGASPDEADCVTMLVEFCRERGGATPGIEERRHGQRSSGEMQKMSLETADDPETLDTAEEWQPNRLEAE